MRHLSLLILLLSVCTTMLGQDLQKSKKTLRETKPEFFKTAEARRIGDQVLLWQRTTGGWPKNIDMVTPMTEEQCQQVLADKTRQDDSTIDNNATTTQMAFLARLYNGTGDVKYRDAFRKAVEYLLSGQYKNGGWPQFWPVQRGYQIHITYNDDAMINTMELIRALYEGQEPYTGDLCDPKLKARLKKSFDKGVECILATQIRTPELAIWCQQHDRETLLPASARAYELPSYSPQESVRILNLLMSLPNPDKRVKAAIHAGMAWLDKYKLTGLKIVRTKADTPKGFDTKLVADANAEPIWARYYDLETVTPYVCDRDGVPRRRLEDIGPERRNGYGWYGQHPLTLYPKYEEWANKYEPKHKVSISLTTKGANENGTITLFAQPKKDESKFDAIVQRGGSIQDAIEKAPKSSDVPYTIYIKKGVYNEKVIIDRPNIVLVGENRDSCIIVGAEAEGLTMKSVHNGEKVHDGILILTSKANDCVISGLTVINNYGTTVNPTTTHQFSIYGKATRTIVINSNIYSDGNDALSLWGSGDDGKGGMYYHADLYIRCPGVDFICPRGSCYATRCKFFGNTRAILWHDGSASKDNKFVVTNSEFDAVKPTPLGRYHHDSQFYIMNCRMSKNIIDADIAHAYKAQPELAKGKKIDPCPWGHRVYYYGCTREGGHSGWLNNNTDTLPDKPSYYTTTASWTFDGKWDPEKRIRDLWDVLAY